jgi:hypothetical protein
MGLNDGKDTAAVFFLTSSVEEACVLQLNYKISTINKAKY